MKTLCVRGLVLVVSLLGSTALAQSDTFHGWSKDGTYFVFQAPGNNDVTELYFCQSEANVEPKWPDTLNELDRASERGFACVKLLDPNKAPYQWKKSLVLPNPANSFNGIAALSELSTDGENPGVTLEASGPKRQTCYVSGVREDSKLQKTWWHPSSRYLAGLVDGRFFHCAVTLKGTKAAQPAPAPKPTKPKKK